MDTMIVESDNNLILKPDSVMTPGFNISLMKRPFLSRQFQYAFRDWSLIMGRGGATKREGGHVKFYPYEKGGRKKF